MVLISLLGCGALASAPQIPARPGELSIAAAAPGGFAALACPSAASKPKLRFQGKNHAFDKLPADIEDAARISLE